jgi:hypothetical protein
MFIYILCAWASVSVNTCIGEELDMAAAGRQADAFTNRLLSQDFKLEGSTTYTDRKEGGDRPSHVLKHIALRSGTSFLSQSWETRTLGKFTELCTGSNNTYRFTLSRRLGQPAWLLTGIQDSTLPSEPKDAYATANDEARGCVEDCTWVTLLDGRFALSAIEGLPGYSRMPSAPLSKAGRSAVEFTYDAKPRRSAQRSRSKCRIEIDTGFHSLPCSVTQTIIAPTGQESWSWSRDWSAAGQDRFSLPELSDYAHTSTGKAGENGSRATVDATVILGSIPQSEFRLTAFGLPEPPGFEAKQTPIYAWLLAAAGVALLLGIGFRGLARRRAKSQE